jgi:hypothetical protein
MSVYIISYHINNQSTSTYTSSTNNRHHQVHRTSTCSMSIAGNVIKFTLRLRNVSLQLTRTVTRSVTSTAPILLRHLTQISSCTIPVPIPVPVRPHIPWDRPPGTRALCSELTPGPQTPAKQSENHKTRRNLDVRKTNEMHFQITLKMHFVGLSFTII